MKPVGDQSAEPKQPGTDGPSERIPDREGVPEIVQAESRTEGQTSRDRPTSAGVRTGRRLTEAERLMTLWAGDKSVPS